MQHRNVFDALFLSAQQLSLLNTNHAIVGCLCRVSAGFESLFKDEMATILSCLSVRSLTIQYVMTLYLNCTVSLEGWIPATKVTTALQICEYHNTASFAANT